MRNPTLVRSLSLLALVPLLHACMVVPLEPHRLGSERATTVVSAPMPLAPPGPQLLQVRLYPVNAEANAAGALQAQVMDSLNGHGSFMIAYQGRNLSGEATRVGNDYPGFGSLFAPGDASWRQTGRRGVANAAGSGVNAQCEYLLTAANQGVGACVFSDGARYQMHFGR